MGVLSDAARTLWPPPGDRHGPLAPLLVALTVVTGIVDAVSYLQLGHVFVANMTGNIIFLGFALAGAGGLSTSASLLALGSFLAGALAGGWLGSRHREHRGYVLRAASPAQVAAMAAAVLVASLAVEPLTSASRHALIVLLAFALGIQNAAAQRLAVPDLTTSVLTRTLTGLASESSLVGGPGSQLGRRIVAIGAMLLGAFAGGLLALRVAIAVPLGVALVLVLGTGLAVHLLSRSPAAWTRT
jgi:uncharacterized membrane protein YoaK (UPF0700 family)